MSTQVTDRPATGVETPSVEVGGGIAGFGLSQVIAGLVRQGAARQPALANELRATIGLQSSDHTSGVTVHFEGERIRVVGDVDPEVEILIEGPVMVFGKLGSMSFATKAYLRREIKIRGMYRHPVKLHRLRRFLAGVDFS